jgi:hypothetical protein
VIQRLQENVDQRYKKSYCFFFFFLFSLKITDFSFITYNCESGLVEFLYSEVHRCEDANLKSEERSLKTFLSHGDADESIASHPTEVIQQKENSVSFYFIYIVCHRTSPSAQKRGVGKGKGD